MAQTEQQQGSTTPWLIKAVPAFAVVLVAVHVSVLVFWMYKLASQKQSSRAKSH